MQSPCCMCLWIPPISTFECLRQSLWNLALYHRIRAHLNGALHKSLSLVTVCVCIPPIVARQRLGKMYPFIARQRLDRHVTAATNATIGHVCLCASLSLLGNNSVKTFSRQKEVFKASFSERCGSDERKAGDSSFPRLVVQYFRYLLKQAYMPSTNTSFVFCSALYYMCQQWMRTFNKPVGDTKVQKTYVARRILLWSALVLHSCNFDKGGWSVLVR
jgi:hypothetical protein